MQLAGPAGPLGLRRLQPVARRALAGLEQGASMLTWSLRSENTTTVPRASGPRTGALR